MQRDYLQDHAQIEVEGKIARIVELPFDFEQIT